MVLLCAVGRENRLVIYTCGFALCSGTGQWAGGSTLTTGPMRGRRGNGGLMSSTTTTTMMATGFEDEAFFDEANAFGPKRRKRTAASGICTIEEMPVDAASPRCLTEGAFYVQISGICTIELAPSVTALTPFPVGCITEARLHLLRCTMAETIYTDFVSMLNSAL